MNKTTKIDETIKVTNTSIRTLLIYTLVGIFFVAALMVAAKEFFGDLGTTIITGLLFLIFLIILVFLALRELNCWYWKINDSLHEMEKTNALLTDIRALLIQGNTVNAVTAGQIMDIANGGDGMDTFSVDVSDIPEL